MSEWITLNVGGTKFTTRRSTLTSDPNSILAKMFGHEGTMERPDKDQDGAYLIDSDPAYFRPVLEYLRTGGLVVLDHGVNIEGVIAEAKYFCIVYLVKELMEMRNGEKRNKNMVNATV